MLYLVHKTHTATLTGDVNKQGRMLPTALSLSRYNSKSGLSCTGRTNFPNWIPTGAPTGTVVSGSQTDPVYSSDAPQQERLRACRRFVRLFVGPTPCAVQQDASVNNYPAVNQFGKWVSSGGSSSSSKGELLKSTCNPEALQVSEPRVKSIMQICYRANGCWAEYRSQTDALLRNRSCQLRTIVQCMLSSAFVCVCFPRNKK